MTIHNYVEMIKSRCKPEEGTDCLIWQNARHVQGYAFARHNGTMKTVQRILAIELKLFPNIGFKTRIGTSCCNKLCCNPDHIISQTHVEVLERRYENEGTGGMFEFNYMDLYREYNKMKENNIPRTINILTEKYSCSTATLYRNIKKARKELANT